MPLVKSEGEADRAINAVNADIHKEDVAHLSPGIKSTYNEDSNVQMEFMFDLMDTLAT